MKKQKLFNLRYDDGYEYGGLSIKLVAENIEEAVVKFRRKHSCEVVEVKCDGEVWV